MATHLDLEEQEQLDDLKAFWARWGNLVSSIVAALAIAYLGWVGWNWWQREQASKAASMYDEVERASRSGDATLTDRIFADLKGRYPRTTFAAQAGLLAAKAAADKGQGDAARADLAWVAESAGDPAYRGIARLRLAGLLLDEKKYDDALRQLDAIDTVAYAGLAADRRGDVLIAQGKVDEAKAAYRKAWDALDPKVDYRRVVEAKLDTLGAAPDASSSAGAVAAAASTATPSTAASSSRPEPAR